MSNWRVEATPQNIKSYAISHRCNDMITYHWYSTITCIKCGNRIPEEFVTQRELLNTGD